VLAVTGEAFGVGVLISAFLFGFRHGIDWDHIAAITDITSSQDDRRSALVFGTLYALGHALVVFVIGVFAIVLGERLPEGVDHVMERIVGFTLVLLGVFVFVSLIRHGREFRMRSRWMLIFTGVRNTYRRIRPSAVPSRTEDDAHLREPVHVHAGDDGGGVAIEVAEDLPVSEWHHGHHGRPGHHHHKHPEPDAFMNYGTRTAFAVGMVHGVGAETPTQLVIFLTAAGASGKTAGVAVLAAFIVGLLSSNTMITLGSSYGFLRASQNWKIYVTVAVLTGLFSLVIGTLFLFGRGILLPVIFGG
jgi:ABC-type nickel/cobalt efflux system permease component RcnA